MSILDPQYAYGFSRAIDPATGQPVGLFRGNPSGGNTNIPPDDIEIWEPRTNTWRRVRRTGRIRLNWSEPSVDNQSWQPLSGETPEAAFLRIYKSAAITQLAQALEFLKRIQTIENQLKELS